MSLNGNGNHNGNGNGHSNGNGNGHNKLTNIRANGHTNGNGHSNGNGHHPQPEIELMSTPLLPEGFKVPASRNVHASIRMRDLLRTEPFLFGPGVYDPMTAQLVMYYGFKAIYFSGYSFAMGHVGSTDMDLYTSTEISEAARRTVSALRKFQLK